MKKIAKSTHIINTFLPFSPPPRLAFPIISASRPARRPGAQEPDAAKAETAMQCNTRTKKPRAKRNASRGAYSITLRCTCLAYHPRSARNHKPRPTPTTIVIARAIETMTIAVLQPLSLGNKLLDLPAFRIGGRGSGGAVLRERPAPRTTPPMVLALACSLALCPDRWRPGQTGGEAGRPLAIAAPELACHHQGQSDRSCPDWIG